MTMTVEIPFELPPLVAAVVAQGRFANEQERVDRLQLLGTPQEDER